MIKYGILSNSTRRSKLHAVTDCPFFIGRYECVISMGFLTVFTKALCQLMEVMCGPLLQTLENRLQVNLKNTAALETEKEALEREVEKLKKELQSSS